MAERERHYDAIVLGYGPVGAVAANLLLGRGWRVAVIDRMEGIYPLPRAAAFDGEIMRVFQGIGLAEAMAEQTEQGLGAEFVTSKRKRIGGLDMERGVTGGSGWYDMYFFHQPTFERTLRARAEASPRLDAYLGHEAFVSKEEAEAGGDAVSVWASCLKSEERIRLTAPYLLAADGAASASRKAIGASFQSLGYDQHWLVMDTRLRRDVPLPPVTRQVCDPERLQTFVPMVGKRRRWEFCLREDETHEEMEREETWWRLLKSWGLTPDNAVIERTALYQFHAATADKWQEGRIFLLGDAAHQMPPFLGQGMCSGIRDAANLVWKLDMVKRGAAPESLLSSYQKERRPHALDIVDFSASIGKLMTRLADAEKTGADAGSLDAIYGGARGFPHLHGGVLAEENAEDMMTGYLSPQPKILHEGKALLMDEALGANFAIVSAEEMTRRLSDREKAFLKKINARLLHLPPEKRASPEMDFHLEAHDAIIIRPDRYIFGVAREGAPLSQRLSALQSHFAF